MKTKRSDGVTRILVVMLAVALTVITGCAKRPSVTVAAAPAPTSAPAPAPAAPAPPPAVAPAPAAPAPAPAPTPAPVAPAPAPEPVAARPAPPAEYMANAALAPIHFEFDKSDIRTADASILQANARWLADNPGQLLLIEGHCDPRGTNQYNLALGERRASAAKNYLVAQGVDATRITIVSYGEERPVCMEETEACWAQDRRAMFLTKAR